MESCAFANSKKMVVGFRTGIIGCLCTEGLDVIPRFSWSADMTFSMLFSKQVEDRHEFGGKGPLNAHPKGNRTTSGPLFESVAKNFIVRMA